MSRQHLSLRTLVRRIIFKYKRCLIRSKKRSITGASAKILDFICGGCVCVCVVYIVWCVVCMFWVPRVVASNKTLAPLAACQYVLSCHTLTHDAPTTTSHKRPRRDVVRPPHPANTRAHIITHTVHIASPPQRTKSRANSRHTYVWIYGWHHPCIFFCLLCVSVCVYFHPPAKISPQTQTHITSFPCVARPMVAQAFHSHLRRRYTTYSRIYGSITGVAAPIFGYVCTVLKRF